MVQPEGAPHVSLGYQVQPKHTNVALKGLVKLNHTVGAVGVIGVMGSLGADLLLFVLTLQIQRGKCSALGQFLIKLPAMCITSRPEIIMPQTSAIILFLNSFKILQFIRQQQGGLSQ